MDNLDDRLRNAMVRDRDRVLTPEPDGDRASSTSTW
jgi:hypothetical protein